MKVVEVGTYTLTMSTCRSCDRPGKENAQVEDEWQPVGIVQCNRTECPVFLISLVLPRC